MTQQNLGTFGIAIQMFGHGYCSYYSIAFNGTFDDPNIPLIMNDACITQLGYA
jgi:hypothetical protein